MHEQQGAGLGALEASPRQGLLPIRSRPWQRAALRVLREQVSGCRPSPQLLECPVLLHLLVARHLIEAQITQLTEQARH